MDLYHEIISNIISFGEKSPLLQAAVIIGSQARNDCPADEFSDLDVLFLVKDRSSFLYSDEWLQAIGRPYASFIENTLYGEKERRVLFEHCLDVDFVILPEDILESNHDFAVFERGYRVLVDKSGISSALAKLSFDKKPYSFMREDYFANKVNDFWYHTVWAVKKMKRGELWVAKSCMDCYLKTILRQMLECHAHIINGSDYDTWHNGRFIEEWSGYFTADRIPLIYAKYDKADMIGALISMMDLFREAAVDISKRLNYPYPEEADRYTTSWVISEGGNWKK